ncbi:hypothetical protein Tco_1389845 [Tanacetum coccineum]
MASFSCFLGFKGLCTSSLASLLLLEYGFVRSNKEVFGVQVAYKEVMEVAGWLLGDDKVVMKVVGQCTLPTQGMRSIISMVSISPEGFMPSILLLVVIIVTVVIVVVTVILVVVVVAIIGVVIAVTIIRVVVVLPPKFEALKRSRAILIGQEPFQFCLSYLVGLLYSNRFGIGIPPGQGILGESTSSKFHFAVLSIVAMRKY